MYTCHDSMCPSVGQVLVTTEVLQNFIWNNLDFASHWFESDHILKPHLPLQAGANRTRELV